MTTNAIYNVIDSRNGTRMNKNPLTMKSAMRKCDKLDNEYGAVRYVMRRIVTEPVTTEKIPQILSRWVG